MTRRRQPSIEPHEKELTRHLISLDGLGFSYFSSKKVATFGLHGFGFNLKGEHFCKISIRGGASSLYPEWWDVQVSDDDDLTLNKSFKTFDDALLFYLRVPSIVDHQWVSDSQFM